MENKKIHWENVFTTKTEKDVSWFQENPETSVNFVKEFDLPKNAKIIDIGGGDSHFIDALLDLGFTNLYLLDISAKAIERIKERLGEKSKNVTFIISDILDFESEITFDFWHDRASFHFLTTENEIEKYSEIVSKLIEKEGKMIIGTFSENGPRKCSGLDITPYSETKMNLVFEDNFEKINCFTEDHKTPFDTIQNFIFCSFNKK
ncbi:class I SAM-dependent methyltransferase [Flavobacterium sp.]|uniref:class I SAM-dependent methyltransferase n=1 Tax=Flavobacterium sp. TaxID=239 RepID=UPI00375134A2